MQSGYKAGLVLRVSRYKFDASDILITGYKFNALHWRGPGLSPFTNLTWVQEQIAKTMTSLLIIPSVLGFRSIFFYQSWQEHFFIFVSGTAT